MRSALFRLLVKCVALSLPLLLLIAAYLACDPFMVLRDGHRFYSDEIGVSPNRDYVSTELLRRTASPRTGQAVPDSFIFGNSRSLAFETIDWVTHLAAGARPFHYDASLESLHGVWAKVRYLDDRGYTLRNALLIVDASLLAQAAYTDRRALYRKHPLISDDSRWDFHLSLFEAFLARGFFVKYLDYRLFHHWRGYMAGVLERRWTAHDPVTNDLTFEPREAEIRRLGEEYYRVHAGEFAPRDPGAGTPTAPVLGQPQREKLVDIAAVFRKQATHVRVVVSPLYDSRPLAANDLAVLEQTFGRGSVFDYSGKNDITADTHNYYEASHYRVAIARRILEEIYAPPYRR